MNHKIKILILTLLFCHNGTNAQQFPLNNYNISNGLANSTVYKIYQDKRGFLWFSTSDGLSQFDGSTFNNYDMEKGLSYTSVMSVTENENGIKYISTFGGGVDIMSDTSFTKLTIKNGSVPPLMIFAMPYRNKLWLIDVDTVKQLHVIANDSIKRIQLTKTSGEEVIFNKFRIINNELLIASSNGIYKLNNEDILTPAFSELTQNEEVFEIKEGIKGHYWLGMRNKILHIQNNKLLEEYKIDAGSIISSMLIDKKNRVWFSVAGIGVFLIDKKVIDITKPLQMNNVVVNDMFEDAEGNIWFATGGQGVYRLRGLNVAHYSPEDNIIGMHCRSISANGPNDFVIGAQGSISRFKDGVLTKVPCFSLSPTEYIYCIKSVKNKIIVCTALKIFEKEVNSPYREKLLYTREGKTVGIMSIFEDSKKNIWLGAFSVLYLLRNDSLTEVPRYIRGARYYCITEDRNGTVWLGTSKGLVEYKNGKFTIKKIADKDFAHAINYIHHDKYGGMWLFTLNGIMLYKDGVRKKISTKNGLSHNHCYSVAEDSSGNLWVGTRKGLNYINTHDLQVKGYHTNFYNDEMYSLYLKGTDSLLIGSLKGFWVIKINDAFYKPQSTRLYITTAKTSNKTYHYPTHISLPYDYNNLTIEFTGIDFQQNGGLQYRYKIAGINNNWQVTTNNVIDLPGLQGGEYLFTLSVKNNDGTWGEKTYLIIDVGSPFWRTSWFIIGFVIIPAIIIIYFCLRFFIHRKQSKQRLRLMSYSKMIYLKQQALSALINPHFIFNCMNSIQHYLNRKDHESANNYLSDFASLIRMTMEDAQSSFISLNRELERIKMYLSLEKLRFGKKLEYDIHIDSSLVLSDIKIPNMILQPYVENAIWHGIMPKPSGQSGKLKLSFKSIDDSTMKIIVEDNGLGIKENTTAKKEKNKSYGMKLTQERISLLKQLLNQAYSVTVRAKNEDENITGTIVEIIIPLKLKEEAISLIEDELNR